MPALIPWPFPLPEGFLDQLGYARTLEAFDSPAMRARLTELLRRQGHRRWRRATHGAAALRRPVLGASGRRARLHRRRPQRRRPTAALSVARLPAQPRPVR